jgi:hypothetical protein
VRFWRWFQQKADGFTENWEDAASHARSISTALARVNPGLKAVIGRHADGACEIEISADGMRELFPAVADLVAAAPAIPNWKVVAFRSRMDIDGLSIQYGGVSVESRDIWFLAEINAATQVLDICYFVRGMEQDDRRRRGATIILVDHAIGEYDAVMRIGRITFAPLPEHPEAIDLHPISELATFIDVSFPHAVH